MSIKELIELLQEQAKIVGYDADVMMWGDDIVNAYFETISDSILGERYRLNLQPLNICYALMLYFQESKFGNTIEIPLKYCSSLIYDIEHDNVKDIKNCSDVVKNNIIKLLSQNHTLINEYVKRYYNETSTDNNEISTDNIDGIEIIEQPEDESEDRRVSLSTGTQNSIGEPRNCEHALHEILKKCLYFKKPLN